MTKKSEIENLLRVVHAAKHGDLTIRAHITTPALAPLTAAINDMLDALGRMVGQIAANASRARLAAEGLERTILMLGEGVSRQQTAITEIARKLKALEARSDEIGQIVELFDDVTSETNILALNAAIEASRAGVQGKAFGLVAEDVRKLAERSAVATKDIGAFIQTIVGSTSEANTTVEEIQRVTETLATSATKAKSDSAAMGTATKDLSQALAGLRFAGQDEADLTRALRERQTELTDLLGPIAPLLDNAMTPLGDALRRVLAALTDDTATNNDPGDPEPR
jgi:methyl-accepting chemotaxis protein